MKLKLLSLSIILSGPMSATELYNSTLNYAVGEQASFDGNIYETQRWANHGQSLDDTTVTLPANDFVSHNLEYFERGLTLDSEILGISDLQILAVERYEDRLYVSHDAYPSVVLIINAKTGEKIGQIDSIPHGNGSATINYINEMHIDNNLLYVASRGTNRVDIFDLDNHHEHVMSLGTGRSNGAHSLLHAQSVVTTDHYVVVSDASDKIKVYRQEDMTTENNLRTPQYAYLQFEGKYSNRKVQMHVLGEYLIAQTENKNYYIYDLSKVEAAASAGEVLQAEKRIDVKLRKIDKDGDQLVVNRDGQLEWHNISDVLANNFLFNQPTRTIKSLNGISVGHLKDLHFMGNELVTATQTEVRFDTLLTNTVTYKPNEQVETTQLVFDDVAPYSINEVLALDEPHHILTDPAQRSVKVNSPVKTVLIDKDTVQITNYAAVELRDLKLELKLDSFEHWFVLANIDRIPAYAQFTLPLTAFGTGQFNTSDNSGYVDLENMFSSSMEYANHFDYRFNSDTDAFAQKLASMKPTWRIQFATASTGKWRPVNGLYAREWLIILTNLAYMVSKEEFEHIWFNFEKIFGYNMNGKAGKVDEPGGFFTPDDYKFFYNALMTRPYVNAGVTSMGGGLGSGSITGVDTWMFYTHYYGTWGIIAHEFGHGFDGKSSWSHNTSFANGGNGWQPLITGLANYHIRKGDLPYMNDNINGFYKPENAPYHHASIDDRKRKHRALSHMYMIESYFMQQSNMPQGWVSNGAEMNIDLADRLTPLERAHIARYNMGSESPYLCRFTFKDGEKYYGYVAKLGDDTRCEAGSDISYRQADGTKVQLNSALNSFEWLSLHNNALSAEHVLDVNGQPLCQINRGEYYGTGFVNDRGQCVQKPNVYWSNGKHWLFSSKWSHIKYIESWTPPSENSRSFAALESDYDNASCGNGH